jgi:hypothetical protein
MNYSRRSKNKTELLAEDDETDDSIYQKSQNWQGSTAIVWFKPAKRGATTVILEFSPL